MLRFFLSSSHTVFTCPPPASDCPPFLPLPRWLSGCPCPTPQSYEDYLEAVLARLDCLRRRGAEGLPALRATFRAASELLHSYFPDHLDRSFRWVALLGRGCGAVMSGVHEWAPACSKTLVCIWQVPIHAAAQSLSPLPVHPPTCRLIGYWAECEAGLGSDLAAARAVWEGALKGVAGRYADSWAAYIEFERRRSNAREARTLYKRSYRWGGGGAREADESRRDRRVQPVECRPDQAREAALLGQALRCWPPMQLC
jgi:hypothetical protein